VPIGDQKDPSACEGFFGDSHLWPKWEETQMTLTKIDTAQNFDVLRLKRVCRRCGLVQVKRVESV